MLGDEGTTNGNGGKRTGILSQTYSRRLFAILALLLIAGLGARWALVPESFGELGHYRSVAPAEEAEREPLLQGKEVCAECHPDEFAKHEKDIHVSVQCEDCHGDGNAHVQARRAGLDPKQAPMFRELAQSNCLACHRRLAARPKLFPTVDVSEHFALVGVKEPGTKCQACHSPHEPLFLEMEVASARIHPLIHPCSDCHVEKAIKDKPLPEGHVATFQCKDCHADMVADFEEKSHAEFDCRTCHLFHKDSEFSGRIFKNGNPRFCLMCHKDQPFKDGDRIPLLESFESHLDDVAENEADQGKRCVDCHVNEMIHNVGKAQRGVVVTPGDEE